MFIGFFSPETHVHEADYPLEAPERPKNQSHSSEVGFLEILKVGQK